MSASPDLDPLLARIRACRICAERPLGAPLPHEPRPVIQASGAAPIVICGQAPGTKVHESGRPFTDASGERLRQWLGVTEEEFYDPDRFAIIPMGFCFPGQDQRGGDLPPRRECSEAWHGPLFSVMPRPRLLVAVGLHALRWHLARLGRTDLLSPDLTGTVARWREVHAATGIVPLPHPSWRNSGWIRRNPWFDDTLVPALRQAVTAALAPGP